MYYVVRNFMFVFLNVRALNLMSVKLFKPSMFGPKPLCFNDIMYLYGD